MLADWRARLKKEFPHLLAMPATPHTAQLLNLSGHYEEAVVALTEYVERRVDDLQAHQQLAATLKRSGRALEADKILKKAAWIEAQRHAKQPTELAEIAAFIDASLHGGLGCCDRAPSAYVTSLFNGGAASFEPLLCNSLQYRAPELLLKAYEATRSGPNLRDQVILDLGCGTGLAGEAFKPYAVWLEGVDLSNKMLEIAHQKQAYDALHVGNIVDYLKTVKRKFSLILAADVLVYIGDLASLFDAVKKALVKGGSFAFTVEVSLEADFVLQAVRRYAHSQKYLERLAQDHQFSIEVFDKTSTRLESNQPVLSYLLIMCSR